jgi:hypothetical protein
MTRSMSSPLTQRAARRWRCATAVAAAGALLTLGAVSPAHAATGQSCSQVPPVTGSTQVRLANGVTLVKPPATVAAGTQLVVGARYPASSPYKSVYAFISASRTGPALTEKFFTGPGSSLRCTTIGRKLQAGTRYIQYQLVPKKQGGKRTKLFYKITVQS